MNTTQNENNDATRAHQDKNQSLRGEAPQKHVEKEEDKFKIYVADLAAYNNGKLHGVWISALDELDDIWNQINTMLKASPEGFAEEYAIHDYEGFGCYRLCEYEGIEAVHEIAEFISEHSDFAAELLDHCSDLEEAKRRADESYHGCFQSLADYAEDFIDQTSEVPEHLAFYIDYKKMARDWEMSGDIFTIETSFDEIHIFSSH